MAINIPFKVVKPFFHALDPETAHGLGIKAMKNGMHPAFPAHDDPRLKVSLWGKSFANPVGLAAGFDKNAEVISPMLSMGFGFVEVGTVTPKPQAGNPRPRVFRDTTNNAVINRMGFPNKGYETFRHNIESFLEKPDRPKGLIGINIGMNKDQTEPAKDYCFLMERLAPYGDYFTINISSPNTPGLRNLQKREHLVDLITNVKAVRDQSDNKPPLLVKLAPDLPPEEQEEIAAAALESGIDGLILTNTTLERPAFLPSSFAKETGGLSGKPLTSKSTDVIRNFYRLTKGRIPIIGIGGISDGHDAYEKIKAGASLVQLYSALVFEGPELAGKINQQLLLLIEKEGLQSITDAVGQAA